MLMRGTWVGWGGGRQRREWGGGIEGKKRGRRRGRRGREKRF